MTAMTTQEPTFSFPLSQADRERLIIEHLPQVKLIARRIYERLPGSVSLDDLVSAGTVGLISAIDRFDPAQGVKLKTYAEYKIRGAILDSLRELDWAPRHQRRRAKQIEAALTKLEAELQRTPTEEEVAEALQISVTEYHDWLVEVRAINMGRLEAASPDESKGDMLRFLANTQEASPAAALERAELNKLVATAIERMPHVERTILSLYYTEELTLREIAKVVKLHESRVSQLKTQGILRLRSLLEKKWPGRVEPGL